MKIKNPTDERIFAVTKLDGYWWDGIGPGETFETDDPRGLRALIKHGCVEVKERKEKVEEKKPVKAKEKAKEKALPKPKKIKKK